MKKILLSISTLAITLSMSGCNTTTSMLTQLADTLEKATPFINEGKEWEQYSIDVANQGVVYSKASASDMQFVSKKMEAEYLDAMNRFMNPFSKKGGTLSDHMDKNNQHYVFKYNQVQVVKDKKTNNVLGYCVNYDSDMLENGKVMPVKEDEKIRQNFIYLTKDKPLSVTTVGKDFTKRVCGDDFYNKYKNPKA